MTMQEAIREFLQYLKIERGRSAKTIDNYGRYLERFILYSKVKNPGQITEVMIREYRVWLNRQPGTKVGRTVETMKRRTQNYYLIALRAFLKFLRKRGIESILPERIELAKVGDRPLDLITAGELERLLSSPDVKTPQGLRDRAILELFFDRPSCL